MKEQSNKLKERYNSKVGKKYNVSFLPCVSVWKEKAYNASSLKIGDKVLVFCCGTGLDFPYIIKKIGKEGQIVGVDFSSEMLSKAKDRIIENKWANIELIEADITTFKDKLDKDFDVAVCTLGLSIIPDFRSAFYNLLSYVKKNGEIIIGDAQLISGILSFLNILIVFSTLKYGGTFKGYNNSKELYSLMKKELNGVIKKDLFLKSYYYCIGKVR